MLDGVHQSAAGPLQERFSHDETTEIVSRREWMQRKVREALADLAQDARMCGFERSSLLFARASMQMNLLVDIGNFLPTSCKDKTTVV
jgi:hypothetical protein